MKIDNIDLTNFRNYKRTNLKLYPSKNIIIGNNGTGKTNILESICLVANTRSFRANDDSEMILKGEESSRVIINTEGHDYKVIITKNGKSLFIDNTNIKKASDFIGHINAVLFKPDDLELFSHGPRYRRKTIDLELSKISKEYLNAILTYNKLIKDKNALLKENLIDDIYLNTLEDRMIKPISMIIKERELLIDHLDHNIKEYYAKLSGHHEDIKIEYKKCSEADYDSIKKMINDNHRRDLFYHYAVTGPHKDDYIFYFNGSEVINYASQGQKRLLMLSFKLSIVDYIIKRTDERPILLLDDILSELDIDNKRRLLSILPNNIQTIITATDIKDIDLKEDHRLFKLERRRNENGQ